MSSASVPVEVCAKLPVRFVIPTVPIPPGVIRPEFVNVPLPILISGPMMNTPVLELLNVLLPLESCMLPTITPLFVIDVTPEFATTAKPLSPVSVEITPLLVKLLFVPPMNVTAAPTGIVLPPPSVTTGVGEPGTRVAGAGALPPPPTITPPAASVTSVAPLPPWPVLCATTPDAFAAVTNTEPFTVTLTLPPLPVPPALCAKMPLEPEPAVAIVPFSVTFTLTHEHK